MKKIMLLIIMLTFGILNLSAQTVESQNAYVDKLNGGFSEVNTNSTFYLPKNDKNISEDLYYINQNFTEALIVLSISGDSISTKCRYRIIDDQMEYLFNDLSYVLNKTYCESITLQNIKYIPVVITKTKDIIFGQELYSSEEMSIVRMFNLKFENPPSNPVLLQNSTNNVFYESEFYVVTDSHIRSRIRFNKKKLIKKFPSHEKEIDYYFTNFKSDDYGSRATHALKALFQLLYED